MSADLETTDLGAVVMLRPVSRRGQAWIATVPGDYCATREACVYDRRDALPIILCAIRDGLTIVDSATGRIARPAAACAHPPARLYSWRALDGVMCVTCSACGSVLSGAA